MLTDLGEAQLWDYRSSAAEPADFDTFWAQTLAGARETDISVELHETTSLLQTVRVFDLQFAGFGASTIHGWLIRPAHITGPLPTVVQYVGYNGGRGAPIENLLWSAAGYTHIVVDNRAQGGRHRVGATTDPVGSGPNYPGFLTRGIENEHGYYYRRLITDAVRAIDAAEELPEHVDATRIAAVGKSQGGALAIAATALHAAPRALVAYVPFLSDIRHATRITNESPYVEIAGYLAAHRDKADAVFRVLSYFDGVNFAARATAPALFSTALMDPICPPSTVFGAYHRYAGQKQIHVWPYNDHVGGGVHDEQLGLEFLDQQLLGATA